jgi:hypothetical protein
MIDTRTDHRTPEWLAEFERGKAAAVDFDKGRSPEFEERMAQRRALFDAEAKIRAEEGPWPTDPFNHGLIIGVHSLIEDHVQ